ncbi:SGNH/GDSL hydrolase family protein [Actinospica sp.]|uniref:SGNH/GDSL hydrolase family protein n=1 Tax=Actinospica sp. TaxID=1872142 RepID=UPI002C243CFF|nr:SGNH/GDSL hydrolase family protein [Actinospica sp.]HWG26417.1 SGNH/GDSL hydrolase family protein [Actinospica sp.]
MNRRTLRSTLIAGAVAACCIASGTAADAATVQSPSHRGQPGGEYDYYLALGDSLAWGYQPDAAGNGVKSGHGYADDLAAQLREHGNRNLHYVNLSCPGETTGTMLDGGCPDLADSGQSYTVQEDAAVAFLTAHPHARILVTLDIGANDVDGCLTSSGSIDPTCVAEGVAAAGTQLPEILAKLKAAAGKHVSFIGMNLYDPFLAEWLTGSSGQTLAEESVALSTTFNGVLGAGYAAFGVPVADVSSAFQTTDFTDTTSLGGTTVPVNVADICELTWMCAPSPVGPNIHANNAGYAVIARAFESVLSAGHQRW